MKKLLSLISAIAVFLAPYQPAYATTLTTGLVSYYKLDETSGTRADSTASANNLTDGNTVTYGTGVINNAASFASASSEYLYKTTNLGIDGTGDMSVSLWFNAASTPGRDVTYTIMSHSSTGGTSNYWKIKLSSDGTVYLGITVNTQDCVSAFTPTTGVWYNLVATRSGNDYVLYKNGTSFVTCSKFPSNGGQDVFQLGRDISNTRYFDGLIDEVGVWNRVLTQDEVTELYGSGTPPAYPFATAIINYANPYDTILFE